MVGCMRKNSILSFLAARNIDASVIQEFDDLYETDRQSATEIPSDDSVFPPVNIQDVSTITTMFSHVQRDSHSHDKMLIPPTVPNRYQYFKVLGKGGMGEVHKIYDRVLKRTLAMKIIHQDLLSNPAAVARFIEEGQIGAQLEHANIVPVYEIGRLDDGRLYFTMKETLNFEN